MNQNTLFGKKVKPEKNNISEIVHEIRNPLTVIHGFLQLLEPELVSVGKKQHIHIILNELNRVNNIISEYLNSNKQHKINKTSINLNEITQEIIVFFESESILRNIDIIANYSEEKPFIEINENHFKQVLINLLNNAFDAINLVRNHRKGKVWLTTSIKDNKAILVIEDNGVGMLEETVQKLYTPFFTTKEKGTGLGLSICKKMIEENNGQLIIQSELDKGSIIKMEFPLIENN